MLVGLAQPVLLQAIIGSAMHFTAYQLGVETRKGHAVEVAKGSFMAVAFTMIAFLIGLIIIRAIPDLILANELIEEISNAISAALAATDPVAVSALMLFMSGHHSTKKLGVILETESLFNDPIALYLYMVALGHTEEAIEGIVWALAASAVIVVISALTLVFTKNRLVATVVRKLAVFAAMSMGVQVEAATITLGVVSGYAVGLFEAPYHHESHKNIDRWLFVFGTLVLILSILMSASILVKAWGAAPTSAIFGAIYMVIFRLLTRSLLYPFFRLSWRQLMVGGSGAIGVLSIAVSEFYMHQHYNAAGFLAGCAFASLIVFVPITVKWFVDYKNGSHAHLIEAGADS